jgi:multicomponent K+:H+ antiporter subunit G
MDVSPLSFAIDLLVSALLLAGGGFALVGALGLLRLRDFYMRLHAPTKASTLGLGGLLIASMLHFGWTGGRLVIHELLVTLFVFMTAPISAHLLVRAALGRETALRPRVPDPAARPPEDAHHGPIGEPPPTSDPARSARPS